MRNLCVFVGVFVLLFQHIHRCFIFTYLFTLLCCANSLHANIWKYLIYLLYLLLLRSDTTNLPGASDFLQFAHFCSLTLFVFNCLQHQRFCAGVEQPTEFARYFAKVNCQTVGWYRKAEGGASCEQAQYYWLSSRSRSLHLHAFRSLQSAHSESIYQILSNVLRYK